MTNPTIATQVEQFNVGFEAQIGDDLARVFAGEQQALNDAGLPAGAIEPGARLPEATLTATDGAEVALAQVLAGEPAVLVFYRGGWCPYCNITLRTYQQELLPTLTERGVQLVAISPQTPEASERTATGAELGFTVLSDPGNTLSSRIGIVTEPSAEAREAHTALGFDVADSNADATAGIPFPTVLVVDGDGTVVFADVHVDYTTRTEVQDVLDATDALTVPA